VLYILALEVVNKIKDGLKKSGWFSFEKENTFSHFLDVFEEVKLGIFEIEKAKKEIITSLNEEQQERLLLIFDIEKGVFCQYRISKTSIL
jgi:hypothetical protein